jgi:hypothetical protein
VHHAIFAQKLIIAVPADTNRRPRIADEIKFHQIVLSWLGCERFVYRVPQDPEREFAINHCLDPARLGAFCKEMNDRPARRHSDRSAQRTNIDLAAGCKNRTIRQRDDCVPADKRYNHIEGLTCWRAEHERKPIDRSTGKAN